MAAHRTFTTREPVQAHQGIVASASAIASHAGLEILKEGGNAIDAAVVTGLALAVTYPRAGNIAGGGFMVIRLADGRNVAIDYRETAPAAATREMFMGGAVKGLVSKTLVGHRASGVPGTIAGLSLALERYGSGKVSWASACEPARRLAADGFLMPEGLANDLKADEKLLRTFSETKRIFIGDGSPYKTGDLFRQTDLGATFARLQRNGPREFYEGETARRMAADMKANGGLISLDDLREYQAIERSPLMGNYRGYDVMTMPLPSSGGVALLQMLTMLEPLDVGALGAYSAEKYHLFTEVMRRAFRDRAEFLGDSDFVRVPIAQLLDPHYLRGIMADFNPAIASDSVSSGLKIWSSGAPGTGKSEPQSVNYPVRESDQTTHYSIVDAAGNAVSNTYTLNGYFGSGVVVPGTGILLNNEMDDFAAGPGIPNLFGLVQGEPNAIVPRKRPLSSMTPTIVTKNGKVFLVTGTPGGATIINTVLLMLTGMIDHGMSLTEATEQPRMHHQWLPNQITQEPNAFSPEVTAALHRKGHRIVTRNVYGDDESVAQFRYYWGDAESVQVESNGNLIGTSDPRNPDSAALGY